MRAEWLGDQKLVRTEGASGTADIYLEQKGWLKLLQFRGLILLSHLLLRCMAVHESGVYAGTL